GPGPRQLQPGVQHVHDGPRLRGEHVNEERGGVARVEINARGSLTPGLRSLPWVAAAVCAVLVLTGCAQNGVGPLATPAGGAFSPSRLRFLRRLLRRPVNP